MWFFTRKTALSNTNPSPNRLAIALGCLLFFAGNVSAHGRVLVPQIRIKPGDADQGFSITNGPTKTQPCAGNPPGPVLTRYQPGQTVPIQWKITAAHRGNCSVELSTTGKDTDFKQLKFFDSCAEQNGDFSDTFQVPADAQCDKCTIRWVWNALLTNELYLDCADVSIGNGASNNPKGAPKGDSPGDAPEDAPKGGAPKGGAPKGGAPKGGAPKGGAPKGGAPKGGAPKGGAPKGGAPKGSAPKGGAPKGGSPKADPSPGKHRKRVRDQKIARRNIVKKSVTWSA